MNNENDNFLKIQLDGDWSMNGVREKLPVLASWLGCLLGTGASTEQAKCSDKASPEIDLSGITEFDVCGCQLLAQFIRSLKQNGFDAQLTNISEAARSKIRFLGFERELELQL